MGETGCDPAANHSGIECFAFNDADEFLQFLRPTSQQWGDQLDLAWVFRGHGSADWQLLPRVWRPEGQDLLQPLLDGVAERAKALSDTIYNAAHELGAGTAVLGDRRRLIGHAVLSVVECEAVRQFGLLADELGFVVPHAEYLMRNLETLLGPGEQTWPTLEPDTLFCLAQHHGIPTRLLDWTRDPLTASFFAAESAREDSSSQVAGWALNLERLRLLPCFRTLTCPRYQHSFLHAQAGIFTWLAGADWTFLTTSEWPTLEQLVTDHTGFTMDAPLRKVTLPRSQVEKLRGLLWRERISLAHLMPTFDNVTQSLAVKMEDLLSIPRPRRYTDNMTAPPLESRRCRLVPGPHALPSLGCRRPPHRRGDRQPLPEDSDDSELVYLVLADGIDIVQAYARSPNDHKTAPYMPSATD